MGHLTSETHLNPVDTDKAQTEIQSCVQERRLLRALRRLRPGARSDLSPSPSPFRQGGPE